MAHPPPQALQHAPKGGWMHGFGLHPVALVMIWPLHCVPTTIGKQLPLMSQQSCVCGGQGFGLHDVTGCQPVGHGTMVTHMPVFGSQQPGSGQGFGVQVVPVIVEPWQTVPTAIGVQLPAASQQTLVGGHGFGTQTVPVMTFHPDGHPAVEKITQLPLTGSQQTRPCGLHGFGVQVPVTTTELGGQVPAAETGEQSPVERSQQTCEAGGQGFGVQEPAEKI